ncbi:hypothetical protein W97_03156 [Coniosporium apollinis CBS 100218]|uniref:Uncharacterized protein n=1 Tax=Coniosporium apollinis (strain CBS 100218) TaxID=1168221 RepID=R7YQ03_CONA1|nr:uncharacterized protein W97_03156 [Coniosporium apollinis CBS 100218]EON63928.1 hypothetical protein W97_03156 [Coniosporium apollinis CBS 100218]
MGPFKYGLEKLLCIANHPHLHIMVKTFTFHADLLPPYGTQQEWEQDIDLRPPFNEFLRTQMESTEFLSSVPDRGLGARRLANEMYGKLPRCTVDGETLQDAWTNYRRLQKEQENWDVDEEGMILQGAICGFPNLTQASVSSGHWGRRAMHEPVWCSLYPLILHTPDNWALHKAASDQSPRRYRSPSLVLEGAKPMTCLLEALSLRNLRSTMNQDRGYARESWRPVTSLRLTNVNQHFWDQRFRPGWEVSMDRIERHVAAMSGAFRHIEELHMNITYNMDNAPSIAASVRLFLKEAVHLQKLHLEWTEDDSEGEPAEETHYDLLSVIADVTWPNLNDLSLTLTTRQDNLIDFLKRHSPTLRHLQIKDCTIREGFWQNIIEQIPHILSLETIHLESLHDVVWNNFSGGFLDSWENGAYEMAIINYCLYGGAEPPILDPCEWDEKHPEAPAFAASTGACESDDTSS